MPFGMGSFEELMPVGVGSFSESLCHLEWVQVCLAYTFWHGSIQYDAICPVVWFWNSKGVPKLTPFFVLFTQWGAKSSLLSLPRTQSACKISSAQSEVSGEGRAPSQYCSWKRKRTVLVRYAVAVAGVSQPLQQPLPLPMPPRAVCHLTMDNQQADSPPPRLQSPESAASPVVEEAYASPIVHCSQYRMEEHKQQNGPLGPTPRARQGLRLAQQRQGGEWIQQAVDLPNATTSPAQGSIRLDAEYDSPLLRSQRTPPVMLIMSAEVYVP